jgi:hypothetical protein
MALTSGIGRKVTAGFDATTRGVKRTNEVQVLCLSLLS